MPVGQKPPVLLCTNTQPIREAWGTLIDLGGYSKRRSSSLVTCQSSRRVKSFARGSPTSDTHKELHLVDEKETLF